MRKSVSRPKVAAIDLFAGAGGFSLAAQKAGIQVLAAVENYAYACDTYGRNFIEEQSESAPRLYRRDILNLSPKTIMDDLSLAEGALDILMGGPPCQGYSAHRINNAGVDDPRNKLLLRYFAFVRALKPKIFVVENVPGLLWPRHSEYLKKFEIAAAKEDYTLFGPSILNARDYGVPQNRKRVFIIGCRSDIGMKFPWPPPATHGAPGSVEVQNGILSAWLPASTVFETPLSTSDPNAIHMKHSEALIEVFASTPQNGGSRRDSCRTLRCHKNHDGHKDCYGRIDPSNTGPTMTTACINPSKGRFVHPTKNHGITVRHAARFQCFPDTFVFKGGLIAGGVQVGNAVPILLGEAVLRAISSILIPSRRIGSFGDANE